MIKNKILFLFIIISNINLVFNEGTENITDTPGKTILKGIFRIDSVHNRYPLVVKDNELKFSQKKDGKEKDFRIIHINSTLYYIEAKQINKSLGINTNNEIVLLDKNSSDKLEEEYWNIIQINDKEFLIQNNQTKNFMEIIPDNNAIQCSNNLTDIKENDTILINNISDCFKFSFLKLYEEVELKPEHIEYIEKEPVDVLIKYIDLRDENLNREGIKQTVKDEDNEELKYSVRSILQNIPWIRKIFILMPNEKVKYFKPIEEISDKFVYVKDKDLIGFDSANSNVFQYNLGNMTNFGLSENFILMDDDCFFGKQIDKTKFFYYDEEQQKVLPSIVTDEFDELIKDDILKEHSKLFSKRNVINYQSFFGWKLTQLSSFKLLLEQFESPLINAGFNHNAIPLNTNDLKEIYELIRDKYINAQETLYSKVRTPFDLQPQSLFNSYLLNVKKRKVNSIPWVYYDIGALSDKNFDIEMFVINTSGDRLYRSSDYKYAKTIMKIKFNTSTPYEIEESNAITDNLSDNFPNNISENISDIILDNISDIISYNFSDNNSDILSNNSSINISDNNLDNILENISSNIPDILSNNISNNISNTILDNISDSFLNKSLYSILNDSLDNIFNNISDNNISDILSNNISDILSNNISDIISDNISDNILENISDNILGNISDNILYNISDNIFYNNSNNISDNISGNIWDNISDNISVNLSDNIIGNISDNISVNLSDNITDNILDNISEKDININIQNNPPNIILDNIKITTEIIENRESNISNNDMNNNLNKEKADIEPQNNDANNTIKELTIQLNDISIEKKIIETNLKNYEKKYNNLLFYFKIVIIILGIILFTIFIKIICSCCSRYENYDRIYSSNVRENEEESSYFR